MVYSSGRICWLESTSLLNKLDIDSAIMVVLATFSGAGQSAWQELLEAGQVHFGSPGEGSVHRGGEDRVAGTRGSWSSFVLSQETNMMPGPTSLPSFRSA